MKRVHLLSVNQPVEVFRELIERVRDDGGRVGWLDLTAEAPSGTLEVAAEAGVLRAVGVSAGRVATVKPIVGEVVLDDLVREHFRGCRLVLVTGPSSAASLEPAAASLGPSAASLGPNTASLGLNTASMEPTTARLEFAADGWEVEAGGSSRRFTSQELVRELRRPRPWSRG